MSMHELPRPIRVVICKMGLDSHYRGAIIVARYLREQGMEVIYAGNLLPPAIAQTVAQEDADVLGLSSLSGNHRVMVPLVMDQLRELGCGQVVVVLGGVIPEEDREFLRSTGVRLMFGPGTSLSSAAGSIEEEVSKQWQATAAQRSP